MDLFSLGTPLFDFTFKDQKDKLSALGIRKGSTNHMNSKKIEIIIRTLGQKIIHKCPGDNARNVCEGFAAMGGFCGYQGTIGNDLLGAEFYSNLTECGIAPFLDEKKGKTGKIYVIITKDKERTFCADLGVSTECSRFYKNAPINSNIFFATSITLFGKTKTAKLAMRYLAEYKKADKKIAIALESPLMIEKNAEFFINVLKKYADYIFMNEDESIALLGEKNENIIKRFKPSVPIFLKKGKKGSVVYFEKKTITIPAMKIKAIDTTGAGDGYVAGTLYGISRKYSIKSSAKLGTYIAAKVAEKFGAGIPFRHTRIPLKPHIIFSRL